MRVLACLWLCQGLASQTIPIPPDGGDQLTREAGNFNWRTQVVASEASVERSVPPVEQTAERSGAFAGQSSQSAATAAVPLPAIDTEMAQAKALSEAAQADAEKVQALSDEAVKSAADAATAAAEAAVAKVFQEGAAYYAGKEATLAGLATVPSNPKMENAQKAAMPYMKAALDTSVMVFEYNKKAQDMVAAAWGKAGFAKKVAAQATQAQAAGDVIMANRLMIQAHGAMATAQMDEDQAKKIWKLAREFNQVIPAYQNSAGQAAAAALALPQVNATGGARQLSSGQLKLKRHLRG